jgi:hypothetical protein
MIARVQWGERSGTKALRCAMLAVLAFALVVGFSRASPAGSRSAPPDAATLDALVRSDWQLQEERLGRSAHSLEAIQAALDRSRRLLEDLGSSDDTHDGAVAAIAWKRFADRARTLSARDEAACLELYFEIRAFTRQRALENPLVAGQPILFMERRRAIGYMLYEYLGWYYAFGNDPTSGYKDPGFPTPMPGGGVYLLEEPGRSLAIRALTDRQLPPGHFMTLALSADAGTIYFAYADPAGADPHTLPGYRLAPTAASGGYRTFHLFAMDADGTHLRQLTDGPYDDFDPCPLPDGGMAFMSTRRGSKLRCGGGSPETVFTLHRMDGGGSDPRTLSFHETHEWHPSLLHDGRIVYTRWDYVDRNAAKFHGLWTCNLDGSHPAVLFGNYSTRPWACYQAKAIPNSSKILFVAGGHHANVGGALVLFDPARQAYDTATGEDRPESLERLTPEVCFAESEGWPKSFFFSPWPLAENYYLVAFSHDPLPGGYTSHHRDSETGLYYYDRFGNLELLYRREGISSVYPIPLIPRPTPPVRLATPDPQLGDAGVFVISDVRQSLLSLPETRRINTLRVFQLLPKSRSDRADNPRIGHPEQSNARMLLGTVPVEADGSAHFVAPSRKLLYFQAVDEAGRAVQGMRSVVYLQPGERRSCVGCHEPPSAAPPARVVLAARRAPSIIESGPDGTQPFGFPRLIQPLLDAHCVRCHDGSEGSDKSAPVLTDAWTGHFSQSYDNLLPYLRWPSYDAVTRPGELGADASPLAAILTGDSHRRHIQLPDSVLRIFYLWLDAQVPFYGTDEEPHLAGQRRGEAIPPPELQ